MWKLTLASLLSAALLFGVADAQTKPLAFLLMQADTGSVAAAVTDSPSSKKGGERNLNIVCEKPCAIQDYIESVDEYPLGVFRLSDIEDNLITTWAAGSAYVVRVYNIGPQNVVKVLDVHSIWSPDVFVSAKGATQIRVYRRQSESSNVVKSIVWSWTGKAFAQVKLSR